MQPTLTTPQFTTAFRCLLVAIAAGCFSACATQPDVAAKPVVSNPPAEAELQSLSDEGSNTSLVGLTATDVICNRVRLTGTRMKRTVCKTAEERARDHAAASLFVRSRGRRGAVQYVHMMDIAADY